MQPNPTASKYQPPLADTMAHTPGPWHAADCRHQQNGQIRIFAESVTRGGHIANVLASGANPAEDAALICASPELLALARRAVTFLSGVDDGEGGIYPHAYRLMRDLKAVIAKAEGRSA